MATSNNEDSRNEERDLLDEQFKLDMKRMRNFRVFGTNFVVTINDVYGDDTGEVIKYEHMVPEVCHL